MSPSELQDLLSRKEGLKLEFKKEYKLYEIPPGTTDRNLWSGYVKGQWDELIKDIIALANGNVGTAGEDGFLIVGVDDDLPASGIRRLYDTSHLTITDQQILAKVNSVCDPPIPNISCETVQIEDKQVLVINIKTSPYLHETSRKLETTKGDFDAAGTLRYFEVNGTYSARTAFVRRGESIFPGTDDERRAISVEKVAGLQRRLDLRELDKQLFLEIRRILKSDEVILYLRETNFGGAFERKDLKELSDFRWFCKRPECEFLDSNMENLRLQLLNEISLFVQAIGQHTFPEKLDPGWNRVPRDPRQEPEIIDWFRQRAKSPEEFEELMDKQTKYAQRIGDELNQRASRVCDVYDEFVRFGRRQLGA